MSQIKDIDKSLQLKTVLHLKSCSDFRNKKTIPNDSPYTGICHGDLWVNNIMFKSGKNEEKNYSHKMFYSMIFFIFQIPWDK